MRSLTRIINVELLYFGFATALVFQSLLKKFGNHSKVIFLVFFSLLLLDNAYVKSQAVTEVAVSEARTIQIEKALESIPKGSVFSFEPSAFTTPLIPYHIDAMLVAQKLDIITINTYTATSPPSYDLFWKSPNENFRNYWLNKRDIDFDTLYVYKGEGELTKIATETIQNYNLEEVTQLKLTNLINYIKSNTDWFTSLEKKAQEEQLSLNSLLLLEAQWHIDNEK